MSGEAELEQVRAEYLRLADAAIALLARLKAEGIRRPEAEALEIVLTLPPEAGA